MEQVNVGDRIEVESEHVGERGRDGVVLAVLGSGEARHFRIRWSDGHESIFYPSAGTLRVVTAPKS